MKIYFILKLILSLVFLLVGVAFFTLFEQKILGYTHFRFGPNKVGVMGVMQPFADALKLFGKEDLKLKKFNYYVYFFMPFLCVFLLLLFWNIYPFWGNLFMSNFNFIILFCVSSMSIYFLLLSGWVSGSQYGVFGGYRSSAQAISYEVIMLLGFLLLCLMSEKLMTNFLMEFQYYVSLMVMFVGVLCCWILSCMAECNRSPFDFSEGESELVSGFNTEYGGGLFSLIFIGEYSAILFFSFFTGVMFLGGSVMMLMLSFFTFFCYLWVRGSFPRLRYDKLMMMAWKGLLMYIMGPFIMIFLF